MRRRDLWERQETVTLQNKVDPTFASAIFFLGLAFGSFLNVCIYRLPLGLSVVKPRSACPGCTRPIAFYDNIPLLSRLILPSPFRHCKTRLSPLYLFVQLLPGPPFLA